MIRDIGKQYELKRKMTDRERRKILDQKFQKLYPDESPEVIHQIREEYVEEYYGNRKYFLPQPEKKSPLYKAPLHLSDIANQLTKKQIHSMGKRIIPNGILLSLLNVAFIIIWLFTGLVLLFRGTPLEILLLLLAAVPNVWEYVARKMKGRMILYPILMDGGLIAQEWTVEDLEWEYESDGESSIFLYSALLVRNNKMKMSYSITREEYSRLREGDKVYLFYFNKEKLSELLDIDARKPVYMVEANCWDLDEALKKLLDQKIADVGCAGHGASLREMNSVLQIEREKKVRKNTAILILSTLTVFALLLPPAFQYSKKITVPDPYHFFGTDKLVFETIPETALEEYCNLLVENYGFINQYPDNPLWDTTFVHQKAEKYKLYISAEFKMDGVVRIRMTYSKYCREQSMETWDGDLSGLLLLPPRWMDCKTCKGTGECPKCKGKGYISGSGDDRDYDCRNCKKSGDCTECYWGKVKDPSSEPIDLSDPSTINEHNWKKAAESVFRDPKRNNGGQ